LYTPRRPVSLPPQSRDYSTPTSRRRCDGNARATVSMRLEPTHDTFPKLIASNAQRLSRKVAIREKDLGIWQSFTWRQYFEESRSIALGLASLGFTRGDKVAIVGDNRPQLYWAVAAAQMLGGIPVPLYQDSIEKELAFIVDHAEARFAIVEDQEQGDKLSRAKPQGPRRRDVSFDDARALR